MKVSSPAMTTTATALLLLNVATMCQGFMLQSDPSRSNHNQRMVLHVAASSPTTMPQLFFATAISPPSVLGEVSDMSLANEIDELHDLLHDLEQYNDNEMDDAYQRAQAALAELEAIQEAIQRDVELTSLYEQEVYENGSSSYDFDMDMVDELYTPTTTSSWEDLQHNPQMYQGHELEESILVVNPPRFDFDNNDMTAPTITAMTPRPPLPQTLSRKRLEELKRRYDPDNALLP